MSGEKTRALLPADHPLRRQLSHEVHARPFAALRAPARATHLAILSGESGAERDRAHLVELCRRYGVAEPGPEAIHAIIDFGPFRLKWERHTEFCSYTVFVDGPLPPDPFAEPALAALPADWLAELPDGLLVAVNVAVSASGTEARTPEDIARLMGSPNFAAARVSGDSALAFMDFSIDADGYGRAFIQDQGLGRFQAGRLAQRLFEIETYRITALLALPVAREQGQALSEAETRLASITAEMSRLGGLDDERNMLDELMAIAKDIEAIAASAQYRFGAARAYYGLVQRRIAELREQRIEGYQTLAEFVDRRLAPAMNTCEAVDRRRDRLARDLARAVELLHTGVNVRVEAANRDLLASMDRRSNLQVRLQQTVEGLSVAAITYYAVSLVNYAGRAAENAGIAVNTPMLTGAAIPVVAGLVWLILRRIRRRIEKRVGATT